MNAQEVRHMIRIMAACYRQAEQFPYGSLQANFWRDQAWRLWLALPVSERRVYF